VADTGIFGQRERPVILDQSERIVGVSWASNLFTIGVGAVGQPIGISQIVHATCNHGIGTIFNGPNVVTRRTLAFGHVNRSTVIFGVGHATYQGGGSCAINMSLVEDGFTVVMSITNILLGLHYLNLSVGTGIPLLFYGLPETTNSVTVTTTLFRDGTSTQSVSGA